MIPADRERIEALIVELRAAVDEGPSGVTPDMLTDAASQLSALTEALSAAHSEIERLKTTKT